MLKQETQFLRLLHDMVEGRVNKGDVLDVGVASTQVGVRRQVKTGEDVGCSKKY